MSCHRCKKIFKEDEHSWYDEETKKHTCDKCAKEIDNGKHI